MNILQINASARSEGSHSTQLASELAAHLVRQHPDSSLVVRDLARNPLPVLDEAALGALFTPAAQRSAEQAERVAIDDAAIAEIQAADLVVLGVPMYNFGIPVQLKTWIDAISRARVTFQYTENGPQGLLTGKKVYVVFARGGLYRDTPADTQAPYLRTWLAFLGMTDVEFIYAEGLSMGEEAAARALGEARRDIAAIAAVHRPVEVLA